MSEADAVTAVLLIAHGSRHGPANDDLHELAARLAAGGDYPIVEASFLELAQPDIPAGGARCVDRGATRVLMIPYFLSAGVHLRRDLTAARNALCRQHPGIAFVLGPPLGPDPRIDHLVIERIRQTATGPAAAAASITGFGKGVCEPDGTVSECARRGCDEDASAIDTNRSKD